MIQVVAVVPWRQVSEQTTVIWCYLDRAENSSNSSAGANLGADNQAKPLGPKEEMVQYELNAVLHQDLGKLIMSLRPIPITHASFQLSDNLFLSGRGPQDTSSAMQIVQERWLPRSLPRELVKPSWRGGGKRGQA